LKSQTTLNVFFVISEFIEDKIGQCEEKYDDNEFVLPIFWTIDCGRWQRRTKMTKFFIIETFYINFSCCVRQKLPYLMLFVIVFLFSTVTRQVIIRKFSLMQTMSCVNYSIINLAKQKFIMRT